MRRALALLALVLVLVGACATFKVYKLKQVDVPNRAVVLRNGLRVVINPDPEVQTTYVAIRYGVGAAHDPKDKKGIAHLLEHLAFRVGEELVDAPAAAATSEGAPTGAGEGKAIEVRYLVADNAWTTFDETVYYAEVLPQHTRDVLAKLADQMSDFIPKISDSVFEAERNVVKNERRARYESHPLARAVIDLYERVYQPEHPYQGHAVIGSHATIDAITKEDVSAFLKAHYHPANATLVVSGPVDQQQVLDDVVALFGGKEKREPSKLRAPDGTLVRTGVREVVEVADAKNAMVTVVWPLPGEGSPDVDAMRLLDAAAGGWFSYRLVSNLGLAYWVSSGVDEGALSSMFTVQALVRDPTDTDAVLDKILEIAPMLDAWVSDTDVANERRTRINAQLADAELPSSRANSMARFFASHGNPASWTKRIEELEAIDGARAREIGRRVLDAKNAFVLVHRPPPQQAKKDAPATYAKSDAKAASGRVVHEERTTLPKKYAFTQSFADFDAWARRAVSALGVKEVTLSNGLRARIARHGALPILGISVASSGGLQSEPAEERGAANLMLRSMGLSGAARRSNSWLMGVSAWTSPYYEAFAYTQSVPSFYAETAIELFAERLRSPSFDASAIGDAREAWLNDLDEDTADPGALAYRALWRVTGLTDVFPRVSRATVARLDHGAIKRAYERVMDPARLSIAVSSDLPVERIAELLERYLGDWERGEVAPARVAEREGPAPDEGASIRVATNDAEQTTVLVAFDAPGDEDLERSLLADAVALLLDDAVHDVRAAMGLTYGIDVDSYAVARHGQIVIDTSVERGTAQAAANQIGRAIATVATQPLEAGQLERVRRALMQQHVYGDRLSSSDRALHHAQRAARGVGLDHDERAVAIIAAWTEEKLRAAVQELLGKPPVVVVSGSEAPLDAKAIPFIGPRLVTTSTYEPKDLL